MDAAGNGDSESGTGDRAREWRSDVKTAKSTTNESVDWAADAGGARRMRRASLIWVKALGMRRGGGCSRIYAGCVP